MSEGRRPRVLVNALTLSDGGGWAYMSNLLRELEQDSRGFEFTVLVPEGVMPTVSGARRRSLRLPRRAPRPLRLALRVLYEQLVLPFVALRYDVLYCLADMAPALQMVPTVVALRNLNIYDERFDRSVRMRILRRLVPPGVRRARRTIFPTQAAAENIRRRVRIPSDRVAVVPHGISKDAFVDSCADKGAGRPYLFLPAALERHKNVGVLIEALARLADEEIRLRVAGRSDTDPDYATDLQALAERLNVKERIDFIGSVSYENIMAHYRGSVALVFPSLIETFGHPLLEAMLAGTPIVASDIPSFREVAGDAALYFQPDDPDELARSIELVQRDDAGRRERVAIGRKRVDAFTWRRSVDLLCEVLHDALHKTVDGERLA